MTFYSRRLEKSSECWSGYYLTSNASLACLHCRVILPPHRPETIGGILFTFQLRRRSRVSSIIGTKPSLTSFPQLREDEPHGDDRQAGWLAGWREESSLVGLLET